jgi:hypothetical protein
MYSVCSTEQVLRTSVQYTVLLCTEKWRIYIPVSKYVEEFWNLLDEENS